MTTNQETPADAQVRLDTDLAKLINGYATPELKASALIKAGIFRQELIKLAPEIRDLGEDLQDEVVNEWFAQGDHDLRRGVWNAMAGAEEIPLAKRAETSAGEQALAKMLTEQPDDDARGRLLQKINMNARELQMGLAAIAEKPEAERTAMVKAWVEAGDTDLRKNILDAEMNSNARRLYGTGVQADSVVGEVSGNASTNAGSQLGGSETNSDSRIARTIPRAPKGDGAGAHVGNKVMPDGKGGESPNPGSGPNDGGGGEVKPAVLIRRSATTGGLGNSQGADTSGKKVVEAEGKTKKKRPGKGKWDDAAKNELADDLLKSAPDAMTKEIEGMATEEEQLSALDMCIDIGADLITWHGEMPTTLAKRDLDASIAEWMAMDPDSVQVKKWVAEALATSEDIPLDLGKAIMAWTPPAVTAPRVTVRRAA